MGMINYGGFCEVLQEDTLIKVVGKELVQAFYDLLDKYEINANTLYDEDFFNDTEQFALGCDEHAEITVAYNKILDKFKDETGMVLYTTYLDSETESDEVPTEKLIWEVSHNSLWQPTPEFTEFKNKYGNTVVNRGFFSAFG